MICGSNMMCWSFLLLLSLILLSSSNIGLVVVVNADNGSSGSGSSSSSGINSGEYHDFEYLIHVNDVIRSLESDIPSNYIDENGKLNTHLLLYPEKCASKLINEYLFEAYDLHLKLYGRKIHPIANDAEMDLFGVVTNNNDVTNCNFVCVERGVDQTQIQYVLPHLYYKGKGYQQSEKENDKKNDKDEFWKWLSQNCNRASLGYINYYSKYSPVNVYWVDFEGNYQFIQSLQYGETYASSSNSFLGHVFAFEDEKTKEIILHHTVEFEAVITIGGDFEINKSLKRRTLHDIEHLVKDTLDFEWKRHNGIKRTFTQLGFAKGRLPDDLYASMRSYYYNNKPNIHTEEWGEEKGVYVNWWENDAYVIPIGDNVKEIWQMRLLDLVQEWIGKDDNDERTLLEQTSLYGMRQYTAGARLLTHVDRETTHAASMIVNIAQGNITEPWKLEVYDHADRLHEVTMEPGEIIYYESAKCLHGRNKPLKGGYYVNLFTHYRPRYDPDWFNKDNPSWTPKPLLDDISTDHFASRYLSPSKEVITSGQDLYDYWKRAGAQQNNLDGDEL